MSLVELQLLVERHASRRGVRTAVPRQSLTREDEAVQGIDVAYRPLLCFVVGGAKRTTAGRLSSRVAAGEMFLSQLELPVLAAYEPPYRSVTLDLDGAVLGAVVAEVGGPGASARDAVEALLSTRTDDSLVGAVTRWVALVDEPDLVSTLAPRLEQEILIRVLGSPLGHALRQSVGGGLTAAIRSAAARLTRSTAERVPIDDLASSAGVSAATFYRHFRTVTGMSPGEFHKVTRLQAARRLLAAGTHTASAAAYEVGYVSVQQFTRDYRGQYGLPPGRDARALHAGDRPSGGAGLLA